MKPTAPGQIWAVALLTLRESVRHKVFLALLLFILVILSSATFFPSIEDEARLRLIQLWSIRSITLFSVIVAVFVAGMALPSDMEHRRVYLLVTKPLSKIRLFCGRLFGFALLLAIFVLLMGTVSALYLRLIQGLSGDRFPPLQALPRYFAAEVAYEGPYPQRDETTRFLYGNRAEDELVYRFQNVQREDLPDPLLLEGTFRVTSREMKRFAGDAVVRMGNESQTVRMHTSSPVRLSLPRSAVPEGEDLEVRIRRSAADYVLGGKASSLVLFGRSELYEWNFFKTLLLLYGQTLIILSITLAATTWLSAPTSMLLALLFYFVGQSYGLIEEGLQEMTRDLDQHQQKTVDPHGHGREPQMPEWLLKADVAIVRTILTAVGDIRPFDPTIHLSRDFAVSPTDLLGALRALLPRMAVLFLLALLILLFKEFQ